MSQDAAGNVNPDTSLDLPAGMFRSGSDPKTVNVRMPKLKLPDPVNRDVRVTVVKDLDGEVALFEGDIVLGPADAVLHPEDVSKGVAIVGENYRWPDGIVYYVAEDALQSRVEAAIAHWEQRTPFRFKKRTTEADYISFEQRDGCWSRVGRQGGVQVISLGTGCGLGAAVHEIGHTLGLWHEQSRSDRDNFIEIVTANIDQRFVHNFDKHILDGQDLGGYDYGSIMHYPATAFSVNGQPTIRAKGGQPIGQRQGLSQGDIAAMKLIYPKLAWPQQDPAAGVPAAAP